MLNWIVWNKTVLLHPYRFIICLDYMLRTFIDLMKANGFKLAKERSKSYPTQIITVAVYAYVIVLLANSHAPAVSLIHSRERAEGEIDLHVNAKRWHLHTKAWYSETTGQVHQRVPWKQWLINREWRKHAGSKGMDSYRYTNQTWPIQLRRCFFQAAVISIHQYGYTTETLTQRLEKMFESNYTRMLQVLLNNF